MRIKVGNATPVTEIDINALKVFRGSDVNVHTFLTSTLDGG
jgi:hypothetical protein